MRLHVNGFEIFGLLSPIVWAIWEKIGKLGVHFANLIRLRPKALLPPNKWIKSRSFLGHYDLGGTAIPANNNLEGLKEFIVNENELDENGEMILGEGEQGSNG